MDFRVVWLVNLGPYSLVMTLARSVRDETSGSALLGYEPNPVFRSLVRRQRMKDFCCQLSLF